MEFFFVDIEIFAEIWNTLQTLKNHTENTAAPTISPTSKPTGQILIPTASPTWSQSPFQFFISVNITTFFEKPLLVKHQDFLERVLEKAIPARLVEIREIRSSFPLNDYLRILMTLWSAIAGNELLLKTFIAGSSNEERQTVEEVLRWVIKLRNFKILLQSQISTILNKIFPNLEQLLLHYQVIWQEQSLNIWSFMQFRTLLKHSQQWSQQDHQQQVQHLILLF